jgi:hypothetical protein
MKVSRVSISMPDGSKQTISGWRHKVRMMKIKKIFEQPIDRHTRYDAKTGTYMVSI